MFPESFERVPIDQVADNCLSVIAVAKELGYISPVEAEPRAVLIEQAIRRIRTRLSDDFAEGSH